MRQHIAAAFAAIAMTSGVALAQQTAKVVNVVELSEAGATAGTQFKQGIDLAVKEINGAGGILGRKIELVSHDTQTQPAIAKAMTVKAIDDGAFAIMGPVFSESIIVSMKESERAEVPNFTGGEAATITQQKNPYVFRTSFSQAMGCRRWRTILPTISN